MSIVILNNYYCHEQDLLNARKREIETENHMKQIGMQFIQGELKFAKI